MTLNGTPYLVGAITGDGNYELVITAVDLARNTSTSAVSFTIDKTAPIITVTGIEDGKTYERINTLNIIVTAEDTNTGLAKLETTLDGIQISINVVVNVETLAFGNHQVLVASVDKVGHIASKEINFTITATLKTTMDLLQKFYD